MNRGFMYRFMHDSFILPGNSMGIHVLFSSLQFRCFAQAEAEAEVYEAIEGRVFIFRTASSTLNISSKHNYAYVEFCLFFSLSC